MLCFACEDPDPKSPGLSGCCQGVVRVLSGDVRVLSELWGCQRVVRGFVRGLSGGCGLCVKIQFQVARIVRGMSGGARGLSGGCQSKGIVKGLSGELSECLSGVCQGFVRGLSGGCQGT